MGYVIASVSCVFFILALLCSFPEKQQPISDDQIMRITETCKSLGLGVVVQFNAEHNLSSMAGCRVKFENEP